MSPATPQEQLDQFPDDWSVIEELIAFAFSLEGVIEQETRIAPAGARALTLPMPSPADRRAFLVDREFAHVHNPPIGSMHMTLPEPFRTAAIDKAWALRHPFAIVNPQALDAVFVFAPRDRAELAWAKLLLGISHANARGML
ncbi:luciferase family protein [Accumulibacter sp.]|uniref:luciferase domain-containing protein n=1 Tax=Accumulibacter sp. TaxID=2053492 RepID=UPI00260AB6EC|nr:luciferase family protein [Accumulibacter sp.]